jgi:hypothetical protein
MPPLLRRVLGKALIDAFCVFGEPRCQARSTGETRPAELCDLAMSCPYGVLYAASRNQRPPFALYVASSSAGGRIVELSLYGPAWRTYGWALAGLRHALTAGLGKAREPWRIDRVFKVDASGLRRQLCSGDLTGMPAFLEPDSLSLTADRELLPEPVAVEFLSPTRLVREGRLLPRDAPVTLELLVARILDRFRDLYGEGASDSLRPAARAEIEAAAARVRLTRAETRWIEVRDYSARTRSELRLGGLTGRLWYAEPASRFLPLLRAGELLHVGKNPTSGCGRIRVVGDGDSGGRLAPEN